MDEDRSFGWLRLVAVLAVVALGWALVFVASRSAAEDRAPNEGAPEIDWSTPRALPQPTREDERSEFVSEAKGYRFWPRSGQAEPGVAYDFDAGHCGIGVLTDFDGSFWQPVSRRYLPPGARSPDAIALVGPDLAVFRGVSGFEVTLERIDGPVVTRLCD